MAALELVDLPEAIRRAHADDEGRLDSLTGLSNRRHLRSFLDRVLVDAAKGSVALAFVDLDRLKVINDTFGHETGDRALRMVGGRLRRFLGEVDLLVRLGGDEFAVCVSEIGSVVSVRALCERMLGAIAEPIVIGGHPMALTASVGLAVNASGSTASRLLSHADEAMYDAKRAGRNQVQVFSRRRGSGADEVEVSLRDLSRGSGIETWFQEIVDHAGAVTAVEALARWRQGPELLTPDEFVPLAERSGAMATVTAAVLRQALALAATIDSRITVHVNVSQTMLGDGRLVEMVSQHCERSGVRPGRLCLEVTETAFAPDSEIAARQLAGLRELGCSVAIDDFGSGYGSLALVRDAPVDYIKIDRSFVAGLVEGGSADAIVRAIVTLGRGIGAKVIAEGVEDEDKRAALFELGCDAVQGNLMGPASPASTVRQRLAG